MKLVDLFDLVNDSLKIVIVNMDQEELGRYDGRDSIDEEYNNWEVVYIQPDWTEHYLKVELNKTN